MNLREYYQQPVDGTHWYGHLGWLGDGYDQMDWLRKDGWAVVPSWGKAGWDLGEWPYLALYVRNHEGRPQVLVVTEGDNDLYEFPDSKTREAWIDQWAQWYWEHRETGPAKDTPEEDLKGPYILTLQKETPAS